MNLMILLRRTIGTISFMVGLIGIVLPVLPGVILIALGLYILSIDSPGLSLRLRQLRNRYRYFDIAMSHIEKRFGKIEHSTYNDGI
jgi:uncharacterized membrane protein YbaN (DUF454 family)